MCMYWVYQRRERDLGQGTGKVRNRKEKMWTAPDSANVNKGKSERNKNRNKEIKKS